MNVKSLAALLPHEINFRVLPYPDKFGGFCGTHRNNLHRYSMRRIMELSVENDTLVIGISFTPEKYVSPIMFSELLQIVSDDTRITINNAYVAKDDEIIKLIEASGNGLIIS